MAAVKEIDVRSSFCSCERSSTLLHLTAPNSLIDMGSGPVIIPFGLSTVTLPTGIEDTSNNNLVPRHLTPGRHLPGPETPDRAVRPIATALQ